MKFIELKNIFNLNEHDELIDVNQINYNGYDPLLYCLSENKNNKVFTDEQINYLIAKNNCLNILDKSKYSQNALLFAIDNIDKLKLTKEQIFKIYNKSNLSYIDDNFKNALHYILKKNKYLNFTKNELKNFVNNKIFINKYYNETELVLDILNYNEKQNLCFTEKEKKELVLKSDYSYIDDFGENIFTNIMYEKNFLGLTPKELTDIFNKSEVEEKQKSLIKWNEDAKKNYLQFLEIKKVWEEKEKIEQSIDNKEKIIVNKSNKKI